MKYHASDLSFGCIMSPPLPPPDPQLDASRDCSPLSECLHCSVRHLAVCSALSADEVHALESVTTSLHVLHGTTVARAGEERQHVYTLTEGALRLVRNLADGRRLVSGFVLPGDYVGLSQSDTYRYDIEAIADSRICRVGVPQMRDLRLRHPHLERKLLQRACQELDSAQDAALALGRMQPMEKLADFLLRLADREARHQPIGNRVSLPMGRSDIADHLGLTMETVSRTFTKLRQSGLIALPQLSVVEILDRDGLERLATEGDD